MATDEMDPVEYGVRYGEAREAGMDAVAAHEYAIAGLAPASGGDIAYVTNPGDDTGRPLRPSRRGR